MMLNRITVKAAPAKPCARITTVKAPIITRRIRPIKAMEEQKAGVERAVDGIGGAVKSAGHGAGDAANSLVEGVQKAAGSAGQGSENAAESLVDGVKKGVKATSDGAKEAVDAVKKA